MATAPRQLPRGRAIAIGAIILVVLGAMLGAGFYTDVLWFNEVGFESVLWTTLRTQFLVGLAAGVFAAAFIWLNLWLAARGAPTYLRSEGDPIEPYRQALTPYIRIVRAAIAGFIGFITGMVAGGNWETYLLWANRVTVGESDPQFGRDVGFFMFELPFYDTLLDQVWGLLFTALLLTAGSHFFHGAINPQSRRSRVSSFALAHLSVLLAGLALIKAGQYVTGTYFLNFSPRGVVTGASYTDVHAQLPALKLLAIISVLSAVLFLVNIWLRRLILPVAAVGIWILTAFLAGGVWPAAVQRFSVAPQEPTREEPFIRRNVEFTRKAYDLDGVEDRVHPARSTLQAEQIAANEPLLQNVRLWDPDVLQEAYLQLQAIRTYYDFLDVDVDRYQVDGEMRQVLLSARELSVEDLPEQSQKWANLHLQYTHGYGLVASLANERTTAGQPSFLVKDVPGTVSPGAEELAPEEPRVYFGEAFDEDEYSIVNTGQSELDYESDEGVQRSNYAGAGGIRLGGLVRELAFAVREGDANFVLSNLVKPESRVLIYRNVRERVARAAPFLSLDNDPYPVVMDGSIVWVVDGYTTSDLYPYSQRIDSSAIVADIGHSLSHEMNYVRNSVKIAVDAYNGSMTFYVIDDTDPVIRAWQNAFPDLFSTEDPPAELVEHFRYPEDLFNVQSEMYATYHITDPQDFYAKQDQWAIAERAPRFGGGPLPSTYLLFQLPGESEQEFVLTRALTPRARKNMIGFMVARSDPGHYGEIVSLQFPRQVQVPGPVQVDNLINQDVDIARELTLLGQQGSETTFGSLVILPIEDSILYVQPLFVTAEGGGIPELKKVFMVTGERVVMEDTFDEALAALFGAGTQPEPEEPEEREEPGEPEQPRPGSEAAETLAEAASLYRRAVQALEEGDFATYGRLIDELGRLLERSESAPRR